MNSSQPGTGPGSPFDCTRFRSAIVFHAHPDDESFLTSGLLSELVGQGIDVSVVYLAGAAPNCEHQKEIRKALIRQQEAKTACSLHGVTAVYFAPLAQRGNCPAATNRLLDVNVQLAIAEVDRISTEAAPAAPLLVVSYDQQGGYGHPDHRRVNLLVRSWLTTQAPEVRNAAIEVVLRRNRIQEALAATGDREGPDLQDWSGRVGVDDNVIDFSVTLSPSRLATRRRSLALHKSQIGQGQFPLSLPDPLFGKWFGTEYYSRIDQGIPDV